MKKNTNSQPKKKNKKINEKIIEKTKKNLKEPNNNKNSIFASDEWIKILNIIYNEKTLD